MATYKTKTCVAVSDMSNQGGGRGAAAKHRPWARRLLLVLYAYHGGKGKGVRKDEVAKDPSLQH